MAIIDASVSLSSSITLQKAGSAGLSSSFYVSFGTAALSSSVTVQNVGAAGLTSSITLQKSATADLSCQFAISHWADLSSSFWIAKPVYKVERISDGVVQKTWSPVSFPTVDAYATILEEDVVGYTSFSIIIAAGLPNDITYRIQAVIGQYSDTWAGIPSHVDVDVTASDPENMGTVAIFTGEFEKLRVQAKNKSAGQNSRAWASLRATHN